MTYQPPLNMADGTILASAAALTQSFCCLARAAANAVELLMAAGFAGTPGDTADELLLAIARQEHMLSEFNVKVRTEAETTLYTAQAASSYDAYEAAADKQGDAPCGISVHPAEPDNRALVAAHQTLGIGGTLESTLKHPALSIALRSYARKHPHHAAGLDRKRAAANDRD